MYSISSCLFRRDFIASAMAAAAAFIRNSARRQRPRRTDLAGGGFTKGERWQRATLNRMPSFEAQWLLCPSLARRVKT